MISAAYVLGVAHPPGFPLHTLLGKVLTLLPWGSIAWRVNLLSALCDATAAALLAAAVYRVTRSAPCGALAGLGFAFSPVIWPYAVTAEVFALNNLFAAGLVALSAVALEQPRRWLVPTAFWCGLGLSNHPTLLFYVVPLALVLLVRVRHELTPRLAMLAALAAACGLLPYLHLWLAGRAQPPLAWGDTSTLRGVLHHVFRIDYGSLNLVSVESAEEPRLWPRLAILWSRFGSTTFWVGPILVGTALVTRRPADRRFMAFWVCAVMFYVLVFDSLANLRLDDPLAVTVEDRFSQQTVVALSVLMGVGLAAVSSHIPALRLAVGLGLPIALVSVNHATMDQRGNTFFQDYGRAILASMPPKAILLITSDEAVGSVSYLQLVEGMRPDVRVIPTGHLQQPWFRRFADRHLPGIIVPVGSFTARRFLDENLPHAPVLLVNKVPWLQSLEETYRAAPVGIADQVIPKSTVLDLSIWIRSASASFNRFDPGKAAGAPPGRWDRYVADNYWKQYQRFGVAVASAAAQRPGDAETSRLVIEALEPLAEHQPTPDAQILKNLGVAYQFLSATEPKAAAGMVRWWRRYLATNPKDDKDLPAIRLLLDRAAG